MLYPSIGPKLFWTVQKDEWSGLNLFSVDYFFQFGPVQNDLDPTKTNWTQQK